MKQRVFSLAAALAIAVACLAPVTVRADYDHFDDVPARAWYADAVNWAVLSAITSGTSESTFSPTAICTRAQTVTFLWRMNGCPQPGKTATPFADVPAGSYYEQAVAWAVEQGIVKGVSATAFAPERNCTCGQILIMIWRSEGRPEPEMPGEVTEGWSEGDEKDAVAWAESKGMLAYGDVPAEAFDPSVPCSRGMAVKYLYDASFRFVTTVEQLVDALAPCRNICLAPGAYDVTEWVMNAVAEEALEANPYVRVDLAGDGFEMQIVGLNHVSFFSPTHDPADTCLTAEPRYANVLSFIGCNDIKLRDLTMGHTPDKGQCTGAVVNMEDCGNMFLQNLDLYGCGTYGVTAEDTAYLYASDVLIRDCSYGGMSLYRVPSAVFTDCTVRNCREYDILDLNDSQVRFSRCTFQNNTWGRFCDFIGGAGSTVEFFHCTFDEASFRAVSFFEKDGMTVNMEN